MRKVSSTALIVLVFCFIPLMSGCRVVEDGTRGLSKRFGEISDDVLKPGLHLNVPVLREVEIWNTKTQRRAVPIETPSIEGLMVAFEATILFRAADPASIRKNIGSKYVNQVLVPETKQVFRDLVGTKKVEDVIRSQTILTQKAQEALSEKLKPRGIEVESLLLTGLSLPEKFRRAVELKLESEQRALQKEFELQQAKKDAEIEIARAEGAAKAQEIVRKTLSPNYLQYLWISTLNKNPNVIYVATEANMPMFRTIGTPVKKRVAKAKAKAQK